MTDRTREAVAEAVAAELRSRGREVSSQDAWTHVNGCWPTDDTVEELADGYEEMAAAK